MFLDTFTTPFSNSNATKSDLTAKRKRLSTEFAVITQEKYIDLVSELKRKPAPKKKTRKSMDDLATQSTTDNDPDVPPVPPPLRVRLNVPKSPPPHSSVTSTSCGRIRNLPKRFLD